MRHFTIPNALSVLLLALALCVFVPAPAFAATVTIYSNGSKEFTVPVSQYFSVFTAGGSTARVYKQVGSPNVPSRWTLETSGTVVNQEKHYGPYTSATNIRIDAGVDPVLYSVGAGALIIPCTRVFPAMGPGIGSILRTTARLGTLQPVPAAMTTAATITSADMLKGIITGTHTASATAAYTLPTGTLLEAAVPYLQIGEGFEWVLINLSAAAADSITLTAGTDHTIVGAPIVISVHVTTGGAITSMGCSSSTWITKKTAANTFVTYRKN